jgi:hypothetical protein
MVYMLFDIGFSIRFYFVNNVVSRQSFLTCLVTHLHSFVLQSEVQTFHWFTQAVYILAIYMLSTICVMVICYMD